MRYILDIADCVSSPENYHEKFMEEFGEVMCNHVFTIVCIDETNDNQFHDDYTKNVLTDEQIKRHHDWCHSVNQP